MLSFLGGFSCPGLLSWDFFLTTGLSSMGGKEVVRSSGGTLSVYAGGGSFGRFDILCQISQVLLSDVILSTGLVAAVPAAAELVAATETADFQDLESPAIIPLIRIGHMLLCQACQHH